MSTTFPSTTITPLRNSQCTTFLSSSSSSSSSFVVVVDVSISIHPPTAMTQPPHPLSLLPFLSPSPLPSSRAPLPLEVGPLKSSYGDWGIADKVHRLKPAEPQPKSNSVHFTLKIMTSGGNNFNYFPENQLTTFKLCPPSSLFLSPEDFCDAGGAF